MIELLLIVSMWAFGVLSVLLLVGEDLGELSDRRAIDKELDALLQTESAAKWSSAESSINPAEIKNEVCK